MGIILGLLSVPHGEEVCADVVKYYSTSMFCPLQEGRKQHGAPLHILIESHGGFYQFKLYMNTFVSSPESSVPL